MDLSRTRTDAGPVRCLVAIFTTTLLGVIWTPALTSVLRHFGSAEHAISAVPLVVVSGVVAALASVGGLYLARIQSTAAALALGLGSFALLVAGGAANTSDAASVVLVALLATFAAGAIAVKLPASFDAAAHEGPVWKVAWIIVAVLCIGQLGHLTTFVADQDSDWYVSTTHPFWAGHLCLPAYLYAAELNERGETNIYAEEHYPMFNPALEVQTRFDFVEPDPFQYPPPFLLLPRSVIGLTDDFEAIYATWFAVQVTAFLIVGTLLASWVGGHVGTVSALLLPLTMLSFPMLLNLQFGQFHLASLLLAVGAMLLFERQRLIAGGLLLGFAIVSKGFPGILVLWLAARRQWKAVFWALGACVAYTIIGFVVLGSDVYHSFIHYQLPRVSSGEAFDFGKAMPEFQHYVITNLQSALGMVRKLDVLGIPGMTDSVGRTLGKLLGVAAIWMTIVSARRLREGRAERAVAWLALLGIASLVNVGAWGDYTPLPAVWLLTFLATKMPAGLKTALRIGVVWVFQFFVVGTMPIFERFSLPVMAALSFMGAVLLHGLFVWILVAMQDGWLSRPADTASA